MSDASSADLDVFLRLDAMVGQLMGGLQNVLTGEGGSSDRINGWAPQQPTIATEQQLVWSFAGNPWARLICEKPARWLQQAGIRVEQADGLPSGADGPRGPDDVLELDEALGLTSALGASFTWARALGGGGVLVDVEGDEDWSLPWNPRPGEEIRLHAYDGIALRPRIDGTGDIREPGLPAIWRPFLRHDRPRSYQLLATGYTRGSSRPIHWTRVLPMFGQELPLGGATYLANGYRSWPSISVIEHCWTQIRAFGAMDAGIERIMSVLALWIVTLQSLPALGAGPTAGNAGTNSGGQSGADAVLAAIANRLRTAGVFFGAPGWDVKPASLSLAGIADLDARTRASLAAASDCPQFVIFGEDAGGLGDGGGSGQPSWLRTWTTSLRGWWDAQWAWNIRRALTGACVGQFGKAPSKLRITVGAFVPTSEREEVELRKVAADELSALVRAKILSPVEAHRRYEGGFTLDFPVEAPAEPSAATPTTPEGSTPLDDAPDRADADWSGTAYLYLELSAEGVTAWREVQAVAHAITPLEGYAPGDPASTEPHLTLLYLGAVRAKDQGAALAAAAEVLANERLPELRPVGVATYEPGHGDRRPVVLELATAGVGRLHTALLRAMAPWVSQALHPAFHAHVTLGFAAGLTAEQIEALEALPVPATLGRAVAACCSWDGERVLRLPGRA